MPGPDYATPQYLRFGAAREFPDDGGSGGGGKDGGRGKDAGEPGAIGGSAGTGGYGGSGSSGNSGGAGGSGGSGDPDAAGYGHLLRDIANLRACLPGSDLAALKNGMDIADIYNELKARLLDIENRIISIFGRQDDSVSKIIASMKDNIRAQDQMNKGPVCFQIPFLYNQKPSSLTVFVFDRKRRGRDKQSGDALNVALNLETQTLGTIDISMKVSEKRVDLDIGVQSKGIRNYLESASGSLGGRIRDAGFAIGEITCSVVSRGESSAEKSKRKIKNGGAAEANEGKGEGRGAGSARNNPSGKIPRFKKSTGYAGMDIKI
jgi:hypothetical protein